MLCCFGYLWVYGVIKVFIVVGVIGVEMVCWIMVDDYYGWFECVMIGIYDIVLKGKIVLCDFKNELEKFVV